MYNEVDYFNAMGRKFRFVKMHSPSVMMCWELMRGENGVEAERLGGMEVHSVDIDTLKSLKVWDGLADELKKEITDGLTKETIAVHERMEKMRSGRRKKYVNVPKELECITCHKMIPIQASVLVGRLDKICKTGKLTTVDDYIKGYQCNKCNPTRRGKKSNPEFANLPKTMTCGCGKVININPCQLKGKAEKMGTTIQELIKGFKCQKCEPSRRGRKKVK